MRYDATQLRELRFTLRQACDLAGVSVATASNWHHRGIAKFGRVHALFGRHVLSTLDVLRMAAMGQLVANVAMGPADAATIADVVVQHAEGTTFPGRALLLQRDADAAWRFAWLDVPAAFGGPSESPHVVVPIQAMIEGVMRRVVAISNAPAGVPDGEAGPRAANATSGPAGAVASEQGREAGTFNTQAQQDVLT